MFSKVIFFSMFALFTLTTASEEYSPKGTKFGKSVVINIISFKRDTIKVNEAVRRDSTFDGVHLEYSYESVGTSTSKKRQGLETLSGGLNRSFFQEFRRATNFLQKSVNFLTLFGIEAFFILNFTNRNRYIFTFFVYFHGLYI